MMHGAVFDQQIGFSSFRSSTTAVQTRFHPSLFPAWLTTDLFKIVEARISTPCPMQPWGGQRRDTST